MPWTSSGEVSGRTSTTRSPRSAAAWARSASKQAVPTAAPGEAARPVASSGAVDVAQLRVQHLVEVLGADALDGLGAA